MSRPFNAWSFCRRVLVNGTAVEQDTQRSGRSYEEHSARLDANARELAEDLKPHLAAQTEWFPIQDGPAVPWAYMAPHESLAKRNHGQSLTRLAERGGLGAAEAELIVTAQPLSPKNGEWDWAELKRRWVERAERVNNAWLIAGESKSIDMLLHCPQCGRPHIDAPEPEKGWANPPHRSHLCHSCGCVWRPADVCTNGVAAVKTRGERDTPADGDERVTRLWLESLGFVAHRNGVALDLAMNHPKGPWLYCSCGVPMSVMVADWYFDHGVGGGPLMTCADLPTRSHVRRLCSALGVTLKERP